MIRPKAAIADKSRRQATRSIATRSAPKTPKPAKSSFTTELYRIIDLARLFSKSAQPPSEAPDGSVEAAEIPPSKDADAAKLRLHQALAELTPESVLKLCALLLAGRDRREVSSVVTTTLGAEANSWFSVNALGKTGASLAEYLQRGHAIACATDFDIEAPVAAWDTAAAASLEERVWLTFGKELANSAPEEWDCVGVTVGKDGGQVTKLYLRRTGKAWWSFRHVLDRPSPAVVRSAQQGTGRGSRKGAPEASLQKVLCYSINNESRALRRAVRAIRARLGVQAEQSTA